MGVLSKPTKQARSLVYNLFMNKSTGIPATAFIVFLIFFFNYRNKNLKKKLLKSEASLANLKKKKKKKQGNVDLVFLKNLMAILRIAIPKPFSRLTAEMVLLMASLVSRTFLSILIAKINGSIVGSVVSRNLKTFSWNILLMCLIGIPASFINSYMNYLNKSVAFQVRNNITTHFQSIYVNDMKFYQTVNLDSRIENPLLGPGGQRPPGDRSELHHFAKALQSRLDHQKSVCLV